MKPHITHCDLEEALNISNQARTELEANGYIPRLHNMGVQGDQRLWHLIVDVCAQDKMGEDLPPRNLHGGRWFRHILSVWVDLEMPDDLKLCKVELGWAEMRDAMRAREEVWCEGLV
jgi:hypothetical protein